MSFILDALKKSESERNRHSGPVLMDVRIAPPRRRLPGWAWALGAVLLANLAVLAFLLLRAPRSASPATRVAATDLAPAAPAAVALAPAVAAAAPAPVPATLPAETPRAAPVLPPNNLPALPASSSTPEAISAADANLPTAQDLLAAGVSLPALQLNLHVYDSVPGSRYILLNSVRLREGEFTPEGIRIERITPAGVVLESHGRRFLLNAGG